MNDTLKKYVRLVLSEGRVEDLRKKYDDVSDEAFNEIVSWDPSPTKKYLPWILKQNGKNLSMASGYGFTLLQRTGNDVKPSLQYFYDHDQAFEKRDINTYSSFKELEDAVKKVSEKKQSKVKITAGAKSGASKLIDDDKCTVLYIGTKAASIAYGKGTKWCITMADANYYERYVERNCVFYFLFSRDIDQNDPMAKVAIAIERTSSNKINKVSAFNALDDEMSVHLNTGDGELYEKWVDARTSDNTNSAKKYSWEKEEGGEYDRLSSLINSIVEDAISRPKDITAKMYDHDKVDDDEILKWWPMKTISAQKALSFFTISQQKLIAANYPVIEEMVSNEVFTHGGAIKIVHLRFFKKDGSDLIWTCDKPKTVASFAKSADSWSMMGISTNVEIIGFNKAMWYDSKKFVEGVVHDVIVPTDETIQAHADANLAKKPEAYNSKGERFTWEW